MQVWSPAEAYDECNRTDIGQASGPMYNAMILPYAAGPMALSGITWYQVRAVPFLQALFQQLRHTELSRGAEETIEPRLLNLHAVPLVPPPMRARPCTRIGGGLGGGGGSRFVMQTGCLIVSFRVRRTPRAPRAPRSTGEPQWMDNPRLLQLQANTAGDRRGQLPLPRDDHGVARGVRGPSPLVRCVIKRKSYRVGPKVGPT